MIPACPFAEIVLFVMVALFEPLFRVMPDRPFPRAPEPAAFTPIRFESIRVEVAFTVSQMPVLLFPETTLFRICVFDALLMRMPSWFANAASPAALVPMRLF